MRFERVPVLLAGAVPFTEAEAEAEQLGDDKHEAASRIVLDLRAEPTRR